MILKKNYITQSLFQISLLFLVKINKKALLHIIINSRESTKDTQTLLIYWLSVGLAPYNHF